MILFALDLSGERIYIEKAHSGTIYYCEECGTKLMVKNKGTERKHHFAHKPDKSKQSIQRDCTLRSELRTANQMSEWHRSWQERYPEHMREVVFRKGNIIFRADIFRADKKEIIEFQHSKIISDDFQARNNFYNSLGFDVIWLFDFDVICDRFKYIFPDQYDEFVQRFVRKGQKVYAMDCETYLSMFGEWKPQDKHNKKVHVCFMRTYHNYRFYSYMKCVTGSFENYYPMHLFVVEMKEKAFMSRIGINIDNPNFSTI